MQATNEDKSLEILRLIFSGRLDKENSKAVKQVADIIGRKYGMKAQYIVEQILFRRALEHRLEGYTLDTAIEICEALKPGSGHEEDGFWLVYRP